MTVLRSETTKPPALGRAGIAARVLWGAVAVEAVWLTLNVIGPDPVWDFGMDYRYYMSLGAQWLADGSFYLPHQLAGPYQAQLLGLDPTTSTLYPPTALLLFVPASLLPGFLWWAVPIGVLAYSIRRLRPTTWQVAVMGLLMLWPRSIGAYLFGNTDMWIAAGVAAGLVWGWPAVIVLLKPTFAPLALVGVRSRWFWVVGAASVLVTLPLWDDYLTAMRNINGLDIGYSLGALPLACISLAAVGTRWRSGRWSRRTALGHVGSPSSP